jgi:hypothetical protein
LILSGGIRPFQVLVHHRQEKYSGKVMWMKGKNISNSLITGQRMQSDRTLWIKHHTVEWFRSSRDNTGKRVQDPLDKGPHNRVASFITVQHRQNRRAVWIKDHMTEWPHSSQDNTGRTVGLSG